MDDTEFKTATTIATADTRAVAATVTATVTVSIVATAAAAAVIGNSVSVGVGVGGGVVLQDVAGREHLWQVAEDGLRAKAEQGGQHLAALLVALE